MASVKSVMGAEDSLCMLWRKDSLCGPVPQKNFCSTNEWKMWCWLWSTAVRTHSDTVTHRHCACADPGPLPTVGMWASELEGECDLVRLITFSLTSREWLDACALFTLGRDSARAVGVWSTEAPLHHLQDLKNTMLTPSCQIPEGTFRGFVEFRPRQVRPVLAAEMGPTQY